MAQRSIGIVGAGQLAQMLYEASLRLSEKVSFRVLASNPHEPAILRGAPGIVGSAKEASILDKFVDGLDLVLFENEFFPQEFESFAEAKGLAHKPRFFCPSINTLKIMRNKLSQKQLLQKLSIPSSDFVIWDLRTRDEFYDYCSKKFQNEFVLKWALGGYDGKGVCISPTKTEALEFLQKAKANGFPVYAEQKVNFKSEWAVVACRAHSGEIHFYPFVESQQRHGICYEVKGQSQVVAEFGDKFAELKNHVRKLAENINLVGSFGVEFFLDVQGKFWVNELAPRVHNSGHYTQDAIDDDQFLMHLKACMGLPLLAPTAKIPYWGMFNLLGPANCKTREAAAPALALPSGCALHWYDKKQIRAQRKMGHLNWVAANEKDAVHIRNAALAWIQNWEKEEQNA